MKQTSLRGLSGLSQFALARQTGISRMRISLYELGHVSLTPEEHSRIRRVLIDTIDGRVKQLLTALAQEGSAEQQAHHGQ